MPRLIEGWSRIYCITCLLCIAHESVSEKSISYFSPVHIYAIIFELVLFNTYYTPCTYTYYKVSNNFSLDSDVNTR